MSALVVAIVGAESTGKTTLAAALAARLGRDTGRSATWVPEALRQWCEAAGRTPHANEQAGIADTQRARIEAAARMHAIVVCDTTPLMTAVYSRWIFGDASLLAPAADWQRRCIDLTLLTAIDLPWVEDRGMRDGPQVRAPVDALLRQALAAHGVPYSVVGGAGEQRLHAAAEACRPLLLSRGWVGAR